jgi:cell division protein FtsN
MKKIFYSFLSLLLVFILSSCSTTEQTTVKTEKTGEDSVYVFDEVPQDSTPVIQSEKPAENTPSTYYIVQVGAFTTREKAETFAAGSRGKIQHEVIIIYSNSVNLFVVQLTELFSTRAEAEKVRNELWKMPEFKDAWILTATK